MMKNILFTALSIFILGNLCRLGLPWWWLAPIAAVSGLLFSRSGLGAFVAGLIGGFALWFMTAWYFDHANEGMLSAKVGQLFMGLEGFDLLLATGVIGGLLAAFGALTGQWAKDLLIKSSPKKRRYYMQERRR